MSTLALETLPKSFASLVREGKPVRLTDKGKLVATVVPPAKRRAAPRKSVPKSTITEVLDACRPRRRTAQRRSDVKEFIEKYLDPLPVRPGLNATAFLRAERDRE